MRKAGASIGQAPGILRQIARSSILSFLDVVQRCVGFVQQKV